MPLTIPVPVPFDRGRCCGGCAWPGRMCLLVAAEDGRGVAEVAEGQEVVEEEVAVAATAVGTNLVTLSAEREAAAEEPASASFTLGLLDRGEAAVTEAAEAEAEAEDEEARSSRASRGPS